MSEYDWLEKRIEKSVDDLELWVENPRLDPEKSHITLSDFALDLCSEARGKNSFKKLIDSIASNGYIPADPIVVWKNSGDNQYYVAEGNRRILALKLLRSPQKAPPSIRQDILIQSKKIDENSIKKIRVAISPSYEACEWYINQRHSSSSSQQSWSTLQQYRWILKLYDRSMGDIGKVSEITRLRIPKLNNILKIIKIIDLALNEHVYQHLSSSEKEYVSSHTIPITIFERWFSYSEVKESWGFYFKEENIVITSNIESFLNAYIKWLKLLINENKNNELIIDTRTITSRLGEILKKLPKVNFNPNNERQEQIKKELLSPRPPQTNNSEKYSKPKEDESTKRPKRRPPIHTGLRRNKLIVEALNLETNNLKLSCLFLEFKKLPLNKYENCAAASLRVFFDLSINEYIIIENFISDIENKYNLPLFKISLKKKLKYINKNKLKIKTPEYEVIEKLLNQENNHSLNTLNNYIYNNNKIDICFLNGFWDFLFPLLSKILKIEEK